MWLLTTRNRPQMCQEVLDAVVATGCTTKGIVWMDGCDYGELRLPEGWIAIAHEEHLNIGAIFRWFQAEYPNLEWYGWMSDDCKPLSEGWDQKLIASAGKNCIAYPDDGWMQGKNMAGKPHVTSLICLGGDFVRTVGITLPNQIQMFIDDYWESVAVPCGLMRYCEDVKAIHKHFANGGRPLDSTDNRLFKGVRLHSHDQGLYEEWLKSQRRQDCIRRLRNDVKLSLILPYWDRQQAADKALELLAKHYGRTIEVVVVDDGNRVPFRVPDLDLNIKVVRLPEKDKPTAQSKAWNAGVRAASGEIIALSCVEVLHEKPVLWELAKEAIGNNYVLAAAWCPDLREWQCHSTHTPELCPPGTGPCFLGVMQKSLFWKAGGFDDKYSEGAGYEDKDFIHRMLSVGARFIIKDELIVTHPKKGAAIVWSGEDFRRNEALFRRQWIESVQVHFVCLNAGNYLWRGAEYVNKLADMVKRNMPPLSSWKFSCLTDDPTGLDAGINVIPLPADLKGWWGKLYLFKRGLFPDGTRMIFLDLDTLIVGRLDDIIGYRGQFATLRDFYHPSRVGPAVMLWEAGDYTSAIWEEWDSQGRPFNPMGDLGVINNLDQGRFASRADKLQSLYPNAFVSYKVSCNPYPPQGVRVICFHGKPRPHEVRGWVEDVWKIGGVGIADLVVVSNTQSDVVKEYVRKNTQRPLKKLQILPEHGGHAVIVGGGPSLKANLEEIKRRQEEGQIVIALNASAHFLKRNGIMADWQVILDARPENAAFVLPEVPKHFICSQCHPSVYERGGKDITIFHVNTEVTNAVLTEEAHLISTGSTVGLIAMGIAYTQGFRRIHLYGMDSSYTEDHHAYEQKMNDDDRVIEAVAGERVFKCAPWMVAQVNEFQDIALQLADAGCVITVAGDGLLPHVARLMSQQQELH